VKHHPFDGEINHFVDCILNNKRALSNLEDAAKKHRICFAWTAAPPKADGKISEI